MAVVDYYLKIEGVEGESQDSKHKGEIELHSWTYSEHQMGTQARGGGGGAGKVAMADFHFSMTYNKASPKLMLACATGEHFKKAVLTCRKAGKEQQEFLKVVLSDLLVSAYQTGGSAGSNLIPVDQISINYARIEFEYKEQKSNGTLGAAVKAGYDLKGNNPV
jgi:type VI secretion system secreted protein Hcp